MVSIIRTGVSSPRLCCSSTEQFPGTVAPRCSLIHLVFVCVFVMKRKRNATVIREVCQKKTLACKWRRQIKRVDWVCLCYAWLTRQSTFPVSPFWVSFSVIPGRVKGSSVQNHWHIMRIHNIGLP